ncbi:MAG TPA: hypothetical protein VL523_19440 [Terriglobia bacterium]|nr:hypothetical protein [Terriglobia bacterium]
MSKRRIHEKSQIGGDPAARQEGFGSEAERERRGTRTAGQSGDLQGLSDVADADSESVEELVEEGQSYEAGVVSGVERASNPDGGEVTTGEVLEDDVPAEYTDRD